MRSPGRPPATRGVYSYEGGLLPELSEVVLDTSFVIEAVVSTAPGHQAAHECLTLLSERDAILYFNTLLELEVQRKLFVGSLQDRYPKRWKNKIHDGRARRRATRLLREGLEAWERVLGIIDHVRVELSDVIPAVPDIMTVYGLDSYDAVHVATSIHIGVPSLLARDVNFAAVPEDLLTIYTDASRVDPSRRHRGSHQSLKKKVPQD